MVLGVNEEDNARYFGEVVTPEASGLCVTTKVKGGEFYIANREFFRSW